MTDNDKPDWAEPMRRTLARGRVIEKLIADTTPRRQDQDPEAFVIFQVMKEQRAAQIIELQAQESRGTSLWGGAGRSPARGIYVDMSDDDLWAEAVATKVRRQEHLKSPEGNAARHLAVLIRLATDIQQAGFRMQDATSRSFTNEAGLIQGVLDETRHNINALALSVARIQQSLDELKEIDPA